MMMNDFHAASVVSGTSKQASGSKSRRFYFRYSCGVPALMIPATLFTSTYCAEMPDTVKTSRIFVGSSNLYLYPQGGGEVAAAGGGVTNPGHGAPAQQPARQGGPWPGPQEQVMWTQNIARK